MNQIKLDGATIPKSLPWGLQMNQASLTQANLTDCECNGVSLVGANFYKALLKGASLKKADLRNANFREAVCKRHKYRGTFNPPSLSIFASPPPTRKGNPLLNKMVYYSPWEIRSRTSFGG